MMLRAASIGLGWWSDELAGAVQGKSDRIRIVSCFSRSAGKRDAFAEKFSTGQHDSYEAVLSDPEIDAVILTTPHSLHAQHVIEAAEAGKHVFVEKPFTLTPQSAQQAVDACRHARVTLAVGQNRRFSAAAQRLKEMLWNGDLGTLLHIETNFSAPSATNWTADHWRASRDESPAGGLAGLGIHMIDLLTWLGGPATRVTALATRRVLEVDVDDTTSALFELSSGATAYLGTFAAAPYVSFCNIYGTKANAFAAIDANELHVQAVGQQKEPVALTPVDTLKAELEEFSDACAGTASFRVEPDEAVHTVAVMEAIASSAARGGEPVTLGQKGDA
ncbi:MAG: Gfo/Idh/MocA family protein [Hyphomicrobiales bacterium]